MRALIRPVKDRAKLLAIDLPLDSTSAKTLTQTVYKDLTENPFAGLAVEITLEATRRRGPDGAKQAGALHLARANLHPSAGARADRAAAESRPRRTSRAKTMWRCTLDALTIAPEHYLPEPDRRSTWASARPIGRCRTRAIPTDIDTREDLLWQTALGIEGGGLSLRPKNCAACRQMLSQALAQGAPQDVIDALLQKYQEALQPLSANAGAEPAASGRAAVAQCESPEPGGFAGDAQGHPATCRNRARAGRRRRCSRCCKACSKICT